MATIAATVPKFPRSGWLGVLVMDGARRLSAHIRRAGGKHLPTAAQMEALRAKFAK